MSKGKGTGAAPTPADDPDQYLKDCTEILPEAIHEEYVRLSADLAHWNARYAGAVKDFLSAKVEADILERELYPVIRAQLEQAGKVTEKMVDAALAQSEAWTEAQRLKASTEAEKLRLYGVLDSVRAKKDMIISLGAHLRSEMEGDPVLREQSREFGKRMGFHGG
jgi:hypothetical protein